MRVANIEEIRSRIAGEIGVSPWIEISQADIDTFADVTGDHQYIHVDPEAAARTVFGGTIAHGLLTLSLLGQMAEAAILVPAPHKMTVNYGFDKVRFITPVRAGKRVRGRFTLVHMEEKKPGQWQFLHRVVIEIEGEERPALQADWISLTFT